MLQLEPQHGTRKRPFYKNIIKKKKILNYFLKILTKLERNQSQYQYSYQDG